MRVKRRGAGLFSACFFGIPETDTRVENLGLGVFCVLIDDVLVAAVDVFSACGEMMADTLGHALRAPDARSRRGFALVLRTGFAILQATLPGSASSFARRQRAPGQRPGSSECGCPPQHILNQCVAAEMAAMST